VKSFGLASSGDRAANEPDGVRHSRVSWWRTMLFEARCWWCWTYPNIVFMHLMGYNRQTIDSLCERHDAKMPIDPRGE